MFGKQINYSLFSCSMLCLSIKDQIYNLYNFIYAQAFNFQIKGITLFTLNLWSVFKTRFCRWTPMKFWSRSFHQCVKSLHFSKIKPFILYTYVYIYIYIYIYNVINISMSHTNESYDKTSNKDLSVIFQITRYSFNAAS